MRLVPLSYNLRSLLVRRGPTVLTVLGIAATVATVAGVLALQQGFATLYAENGREDVAVVLRQGATSEGVSAFDRIGATRLIKSAPEFAKDDSGAPIAGMECFLAVRRFRVDGGETNVPLRGVQPVTLDLRAGELNVVEGRPFALGADEVIVGQRITGRIRDCRVGDTLKINVTPFKVVGIFECDGPFESEVWGDFDRMLAALDRPGPNRIVGLLQDPGGVEAFDARLQSDPETPAKVQSEREYLSAQTGVLSAILAFLGGFLGLVMGIAAVFTATNTMLSAVAARTHEIGILLSTGFRPVPIFLSFLFESVLVGLVGGLIGALLVLPLNGIETGTTNFQTFTEVAFGFRITPTVLITAVVFSLVLGALGGALPAWRAARMKPTDALRRG